MKPLVKKILESGLVGKHTARMMERWGWLEPGAADLAAKDTVEKTTEEALTKLAEDIGELLGDECQVKETRLEVRTMPPSEFWSGRVGSFSAAEDQMGALLVTTSVVLQRGDELFALPDGNMEILDSRVLTKGPTHRVLDVDEMYVGDKRVGYQLTVEKC